MHTYKGVSLIPISCPKNKYLEAIIHTFKSVLKARELKPDILHIHAIGPSLFAPFARALGMKVVITHHGTDYKRKKWPPLAKMFLRFCEWIGMTFANDVITIANNISDDIKRRFGRNAVVILNGVEIPRLVDTDDILEKFGLQKKKYILVVGRFVSEKGFDDLIDAFSSTLIDTDKKRMDPDKSDGLQGGNWKLVIIGDADHKDKYSLDLKMKASKNSKVILTGFLTGQPLNELYSHAGLFVLPSYYEGLPIVLLEAMSYGLSCIASDIPGNRNIELSDDRYFRAGDVKSLEAKLKEFVNKPWKEEERQKQIDIIAKKYSWEKIADETLKVYKQVAS
jgi:glycosyltransferase involved in cell wall biosynthesis